ncbi:MAG: hypothetical protein BWY82_00323 [Verrucomicrobia bacterium ADurb.Bin474]|nr:MAG: hypothetical protein BWY82_00323 [Verrucomicrobia bacterium ADurb.Bin474]
MPGYWDPWPVKTKAAVGRSLARAVEAPRAFPFEANLESSALRSFGLETEAAKRSLKGVRPMRDVLHKEGRSVSSPIDSAMRFA